MWTCRRMRGLIAASLYEPLAERERAALDRHLESCAPCRRERDALGRVAAGIPRVSPPIPMDLAPGLRARLHDEAATVRPAVPTLRWAMAAALLLAVGGVAFVYTAGPGGPGGSGRVAQTPESALGAILGEAETLAADGNFTGAFSALKAAVAAHPHDRLAGEAQMRLADLAYADLRWYDVAEQEYRALVGSYPEAVGDAPEPVRNRVTERRNLLDEGRRDNFAMLHALDAARSNPIGAFKRYESIVSGNPHALAADQALREMVALVGAQSVPDSADARLAALHAARARVESPVAVAKLNLAIGNVAWQELQDLDTAREAYRQATESPEPVLAQLARESLQALNTRNP